MFVFCFFCFCFLFFLFCFVCLFFLIFRRNPSPSSADGSWITTDWSTPGNRRWRCPRSWCFQKRIIYLWNFMSPSLLWVRLISFTLRGMTLSSLYGLLILSKHLFGYISGAVTYLGCYVDAEDRALPDSLLSSDSMTHELCFSHCIANDLPYAGLQYSLQCFCGRDGTDYAIYGRKDESECGATCRGDATQICGGTWRMNIYYIRKLIVKYEEL